MHFSNESYWLLEYMQVLCTSNIKIIELVVSLVNLKCRKPVRFLNKNIGEANFQIPLKCISPWYNLAVLCLHKLLSKLRCKLSSGILSVIQIANSVLCQKSLAQGS